MIFPILLPRLDAAGAQRVRAAEQSLDLRMARHLGIGSDRGEGRGALLVTWERARATAAYGRAIELVTKHLEEHHNDAFALSDLARLRALFGAEDQALECLQRALSMVPEHPQLLYTGVVIHARFGHPEEALDWLEKALAAGYSPSWVRNTPELDSLRESERFQAVLSEY